MKARELVGSLNTLRESDQPYSNLCPHSSTLTTSGVNLISHYTLKEPIKVFSDQKYRKDFSVLELEIIGPQSPSLL